MGYYTDFEIEVISGEEDLDRNVFAQELTEKSTYDWDEDLVLGGAKWYDWKEDMLAVSLLYPNVLFRLSGNGEESGDMWQCYFRDGKYQFCQSIVTYEHFDERKMK